MFLKTTVSSLFIFCLLFCSFPGALAQDQIQQNWPVSRVITESKWQNMSSHPRLFADAKKWTELKKQLKTDTTSQQLFALIKERAEIVLKSPSLIVAGVGVFHGEARQMRGRILTPAMTYKLNGEKQFLEGSIQEMTELANAENCRPDHFLSCSESTEAIAIGLDWLYNVVK